jgi:rare lipoprotein A
VLPKLNFLQWFWVALSVCGLLMVASDRAEAEDVLASWYGPGFDGNKMASGATYEADGLSTAHKSLPMGTELVVGYHGRNVPVTVNDRGPYAGERELDLSQGAARALGLTKSGVDYVEVNCANGGIYPNCSEAPPVTPATTTPTTPAMETPATTTPVLESPTPESPVLEPSALEPSALESPILESPVLDSTTFESPVYDPSTAVQDSAGEQVDGGGAYTVGSGDTLSNIAAQLGVSVDDLMAQNGISNPDLIYSGQTLLY